MRAAISDGKIYELVELVYAAAQSPEVWQTFVTRFAELIPGTATTLLVRSASAEGGLFMVHAMFSPGAIPEYLRNHSESSPWITILRAVETGVPFATEDHVPLGSIKQTPFYKKLLKPYGIGGGFGVKLWDRVDGRAMFMATCAEDARATMKPRLLPVLAKLAPHLQRSLELCWALRRERAKGIEDGLARQADAVFVLNERREVVFMNAAARKATEDGLVRIAPGNQLLRFASRKDNTAFDALFKSSNAAPLNAPANPQRMVSLMATPAAPSRRLMTFSAPGEIGPNLLEILPLHHAELSTIGSIFRDRIKEPHALVTVRRRGGLSAPSIEDIRTVLGLSQKEAEVTLALVEGQSVEDYANSRDVAIDTIRWHLKNIYRQTDCNSQADLVRLVLSLVGRANLG